jgi:glucose/arabinose dehydrogenase
MKRGFTVLLAAALLSGLPSSGGAAPRAVSSTLVLACRPSNPQCWPTAFAFAPDGTIWYVERFTGQIRFYSPNTKQDVLWTTLPNVSTVGERGVLGVTLDPNFRTSPWVYVYYSKITRSGVRNRIVRLFRNSNGSFVLQQLLVIPSGSIHNGGKMKFSFDGKLWVVAGETGRSNLAQDKTSLAGKVLHIFKTGGIPPGNPFGTAVFSYGLRNSFGFTFDPATRYLWETENGPECNDEINIIVKAGNFGWGSNQSCPHTNNSGPYPRQLPKALYNPTIAPTGAAFCTSCGLGPSIEGNLLFGSWKDQAVRALQLSPDRKSVASSTVIYTHTSGILDLEAGSGAVYFSSPDGIYKLV